MQARVCRSIVLLWKGLHTGMYKSPTNADYATRLSFWLDPYLWCSEQRKNKPNLGCNRYASPKRQAVQGDENWQVQEAEAAASLRVMSGSQ